MNAVCPVCGYNKLLHPPKDHYICPCCGTEFGFDDDAYSHEELRREWIAKGMLWFSRSTQPPLNWNGYKQLLSAGLCVTIGATSARASIFNIGNALIQGRPSIAQVVSL